MAETMQTSKERLSQAIEKAGLSVKSTFVPFSQSRNKDEKQPSLNWKVTLVHNGKDVITTDYMAGCAHCPAYQAIDEGRRYRGLTVDEDSEVRKQCESGKVFKPVSKVDRI